MSVGKVVTIISLLLMVVGGWICFNGLRLMGSNEGALDHKVASAAVDLSVAGEHEMPYVRRYTDLEGQQLRFELEPGFKLQEQMLSAFEDFRALVEVKTKDGEILYGQEVKRDSFELKKMPYDESHTAPLNLNTPHTYFPSVGDKEGDYTLVLKVLTPAKDLAERKQRLEIRNRVDAWSTAYVRGGIYAAVGAFAFLAGWAILDWLVKRKRKKAKKGATE